MKASEQPAAIRSRTRFVSPEVPQHTEVPVDTNHAELSEDQPDPNVETADGLGVLDDHSQQTDPDEVLTQGGQADAEINPKSRVTAGRHVKHEPGSADAKRRAKHVAATRKQREKANFGKK